MFAPAGAALVVVVVVATGSVVVVVTCGGAVVVVVTGATVVGVVVTGGSVVTVTTGVVVGTSVVTGTEGITGGVCPTAGEVVGEVVGVPGVHTVPDPAACPPRVAVRSTADATPVMSAANQIIPRAIPRAGQPRLPENLDEEREEMNIITSVPTPNAEGVTAS